MDCDSFVLSIETQNIIMDLKNLENLFDFSKLNENHDLFSNKNKKSCRQIHNRNSRNYLD